MDKIESYRFCIQELIAEYARHANLRGEETAVETIFDTARDHYQLLYVGWQDVHRTFGCVMHLDIRDRKIWIQHDSTDADIANQLTTRGVPKEDIVLAFQAPYKRPYTGFAVS